MPLLYLGPLVSLLCFGTLQLQSFLRGTHSIILSAPLLIQLPLSLGSVLACKSQSYDMVQPKIIVKAPGSSMRLVKAL